MALGLATWASRSRVGSAIWPKPKGRFTRWKTSTRLTIPAAPFGAASAVLGLVSAVNRPPLRINLDLYHTQIGEGALIRWCEACLPRAGWHRWPTIRAAADPEAAPALSPAQQRRAPLWPPSLKIADLLHHTCYGAGDRKPFRTNA